MLIVPDHDTGTVDIFHTISRIAVIHATSNLVCVIFLLTTEQIAHPEKRFFQHLSSELISWAYLAYSSRCVLINAFGVVC